MEGVGAQNGGEVRRLHIIYFLCRKGRIEHPHLIRVHHHSRNGVRLRDIKRWLSELRGKDMPESYAWSYKRRYKTGFVWQDLLDEDLITPIADNEYVLKGSEIPSATFDNKFCDEKGEKPPSSVEAKSKHQKSSPKASSEEEQESAMNMLTKPLLEIEEQSSTTFSSDSSSLTDDTMKLEHENQSSRKEVEDNHLILKMEEQEDDDNLNENVPFIIPRTSNENKKKIHFNNFIKVKKSDPIPEQSSESSSSKSKFSKSRSYSNNASSMFRNLITCGTVDTNDSGMMVIRRSTSKSKPSKLDVSAKKGNQKMAEICRGDTVGGSERISRISWRETQENERRRSCDGASESKQKKKNDENNPKPVPTAYKPRYGPNCSQCGRTFKPEHLHKHMKSCRGMKALAKGGAAATANTSFHQRSTDSPLRHSISSHYLTNK